MSILVISGKTGPDCPCCHPGCITGSFSCETRGGDAFLCGIPEYNSPSTPPKFYGTQTPVGAVSVNATTDTYSGTYDTDLVDCVTTNTQNRERCNPGGCIPGLRPLAPWFDTFGFSEWIRATNQTQDSYTGPGFVGADNLTGNATATLTNEDTDDNAIVRLLNDSDWGPCTGIPCCLAQWQVRTGQDFIYNEARWALTFSGLNPGQRYGSIVETFRRVYGVGSYVPFQTIMVTGTADGTGNLVINGIVPNEIGFQTFAVAGDCP